MTTLFLALESRDIHTTILLVHVYAVHVHGYVLYVHVFIMCTTQCMIGSVFTSGVCHCVCMCMCVCV